MCEYCDDPRLKAALDLHTIEVNGVVIPFTLNRIFERISAYVEDHADSMNIEEKILLSAALASVQQAGRFMHKHYLDHALTPELAEQVAQKAVALHGITVEQAKGGLYPQDEAVLESMRDIARDNGLDVIPKNAFDWAKVFGTSEGGVQ